MKILYINTYSFWRKDSIMLHLCRISNYLNSRKHELNEEIQEDFIDLEKEDLPEFSLNNIEHYRQAVLELFTNLYLEFPFDVVALSCYSSFNYINTLEIGYLLKKKINPNCILVLGGIHPTIKPEDFQSGNLPDYIYKDFPELGTETPFDYLIREEGELAFFELISKIINHQIEVRESWKDDCIILEPRFINNLEELPLIDLKLLERYKEKYAHKKILWIDFSRGCPFKCSYCYNSENYMVSYNKVRIKPPEMCIQELKILNSIDWLHLDAIYLTDPLFFPKKKSKREFLKLMESTINQHGEFPFELVVMERVDTIDLELFPKFKKLNIGFDIGLENCSKTLLKKIGKVFGKTNDQIDKRVDHYLNKAKKVFKAANEFKIPIVFNFMTCMPGSDKKSIKENFDFLFDKDQDGKSLAERYLIMFQINQYMAYYGTQMYHIAKEKFGAKIHFKEWWKIFDKDQVYYATYVDPSNNLSFENAFEETVKYLKHFYKKQLKLAGLGAIKALLDYHKEESHSLKLYRIIRNKKLRK